jgi:hypothetical protein
MTAMTPFSDSLLQDEARLGSLAMQFRGTRRDEERRAIAQEYSRAVDRLIHGGRWHEVPPPEDQLPDAWMPRAFFEYWLPPPAAS